MRNDKYITILGIDPALNNTGWSILKTSGCGDIIFENVGHVSNNIKDDYYCKLENIRQKVEEIIDTYKPNILSIFFALLTLFNLKRGCVRPHNTKNTLTMTFSLLGTYNHD